MRKITVLVFIGWALLALVTSGEAPSAAAPVVSLETSIANRACVRPVEGALTDCEWSNPAITTIAAAPIIERIGHVGGLTEGLFAQGQYAYVGVGPALLILDISDPTHPTEIGKALGEWERVDDVYVVGDHAYIAGHNLWSMDVSNPAAPTPIGLYETSQAIQDIAGMGNYLYVVEREALDVIDVSNPSDPVKVGSYGLSEGTDYVAVSNDPQTDQVYAYAASDDGLWIIDVSDPTNPVFVGFYDSQGYVSSLAVAGTYAYIDDCVTMVYDTTCELAVINVSNPATPTKVGTLDGGMGATSIAGSYAYGTVGNGLRVVDISDPAAPVEVGFWGSDFPLRGVSTSFVNGYVYVSDLYAGLRVIDVSDPHAPVETFFYNNAPILAGEIEMGHDLVYVREQQSSSLLRLIDVSDPTSPILANRCVITSEATAIAIADDYAYVTAGGFRVMDISNPAAPVEVGFSATPGFASDMVVRDNLVYAVNREGDDGLQIVDVSEPTAPLRIGFLDGWSADHLAVAPMGDYVYAAGTCDDGPCMRVIDVSDATAPVQVSSLGIVDAEDVIAAERYVYVVGYESLQVIDVSDPTTPKKQGIFAAPYGFYAGAVADGYVYIAGIGGLWVIDVSDPRAPVQTDFYDGPSIDDIVVVGDIIYASAGRNGLLVFRFNDPTVAIRGHTTHANGAPFPGVTLSASGGLTTTTDADGAYAFTRLITGTFTLTPSLPGYTFWPPTRTVSVPPDAAGQDFTVLAAPVSTTLPLSGTANPPASLTYTDTQGLVTRLDFSPGAFSRPTQVTLRPILASGGPGWAFAGHAFELSAYQAGSAQLTLRLQRPVTVTLHYSDADVALVSDEAQLALLRWSGQAWQDAAQTCDPPSTYARDLEQNALSVPICHLSRFGLFGPTHQVYLPLVQRAR